MFRARIVKDGELRRAIETMSLVEYEAAGYYERWVVATEKLLVEKGVLTRAEIDAKVAELGAPV